MTQDRLRVALLGPLELSTAAGPVEVRGVRLRGLLARLALDPGRYVSGDELAAALWGDDVPVDQANALQSLVSRLRRVLPDPAVLESRPGGYRLVVEREAVDAQCFEALAREGRRLLASAEPVAAAAQLRDALALWRGPALADVVELPFAAAPAARLEELRLSAVEDRIGADLVVARAAARIPDVVAELDELTSAHPLRERLWVLRVSALRDAGRAAEALATYEQARTTLADELGADPGPELRELHLSLLRGEGAMPAAVAARPGRPGSSRLRMVGPLTSFVGRTAELDRIAALLATNRLVTLVGPGGAGKTRLALHAAQEAAERFGPHVWTVELASVNDPGDIDAALLSALTLREANVLDGLRESSSRDPLERVCEALGDRTALLVLDNCEHLVDAAARLTEHLLTRCPQLHVLATSREPLAVYGETLCPVPPLGLPERGLSPAEALGYPAVRLFADRAAAVVPGFAVDEDTVDAVVQVCRRLDGLPLAIELAAARLRSLPLAEVEARLDDRFRLLTGGSRTAVPRHRTLRAVVEWSWDLLEPGERRLAERFSVLTAGGTPDSVLAVCVDAGGAGDADGPADRADVLDRLAALVDKSLLQVADGVDPRYRMLETLREYGAEQLTARGEIHDARVAHAHYFRDLAETADPHLRSADQLEWIRRLTDERDNLLAALRFAADDRDADTALRIGAAMGWFWFMQGSHVEAATWLRIAIDVPGEGPPAQTAACLSMYTVTAWALGLIDGAESGELTSRVQRAAEGARGQEWRYPALAILQPVLRMIADDNEGALAAIDAARPVDAWTSATLLMMRAMLMENSGDADGMLDNAGARPGGLPTDRGPLGDGHHDGRARRRSDRRRRPGRQHRHVRGVTSLAARAQRHLGRGGDAAADGRCAGQSGSARRGRGAGRRGGGPRPRAGGTPARADVPVRARGAGPDARRAGAGAPAAGRGRRADGRAARGTAAPARGHAGGAGPRRARRGRRGRGAGARRPGRAAGSYHQGHADHGERRRRRRPGHGGRGRRRDGGAGAGRGALAARDRRPTLDDLRVLTASVRGRIGDAAFEKAYDSGAALGRDSALDLVDPG